MAADRRNGFALTFVVVMLAVVAIVATVVVINSANATMRYNVQLAATALLRFRSEVGTKTGATPAFASDVGANPGHLSQLNGAITNADSNSCNQTYGNPNVNGWRGPYHLVPLLPNRQYQIERGLVVEDTLMRIPSTGPSNQNATLALIMFSVPADLAQGVGLALDGVSTGAGPTVIFTPNGSNPVTMYYYVPIVGC